MGAWGDEVPDFLQSAPQSSVEEVKTTKKPKRKVNKKSKRKGKKVVEKPKEPEIKVFLMFIKYIFRTKKLNLKKQKN